MQKFKFWVLLMWAKLLGRSVVIQGKTSKGKTVMTKQLIAEYTAAFQLSEAEYASIKNQPK